MKPHYFEQDSPDSDDWALLAAIHQGYVPRSCLLGGMVALDEVRRGHDPCAGCEGPREKCHGRPKKKDADV